jgi:DNA-directed RNA polymerase specialized sigma subunit
VARYGEDIFSEAIFILYDKIKTYDLEYKDRQGNLKQVRFSSYIWKRIDGLIIDSVKKEIKRERCQISPDWERYESEITASINV